MVKIWLPASYHVSFSSSGGCAGRRPRSSAVSNPFGNLQDGDGQVISARGRVFHWPVRRLPAESWRDRPRQFGRADLRYQRAGHRHQHAAIYSPNGGSVGIGFAVPFQRRPKVVAELEAHGKVDRGWLGVQIQEVTPAIAGNLGLKADHGALVALVSADSPAAKAGLQQGDVILAFNGTDIAKMHDLPRLVAGIAPGSKAEMTVWRDGQQSTLAVTVGEAPENPRVASAETPEQPKDDQADAMGLQFSALTSDLRRELHLGREVHGVIVTKVENGSAGDELGLTEGDIIVSINQQPVERRGKRLERQADRRFAEQNRAAAAPADTASPRYLGFEETGKNQGWSGQRH